MVMACTSISIYSVAFISLGSVFWSFQCRGPAYLFVKFIPKYFMFFAAIVNGVIKFPVVSC